MSARQESIVRGLQSWILPWLLFVVLAFGTIRQTSATWDEPAYIVAGLSYLTTGRFVMLTNAPPLPSYIAGAAAWTCGLRLPGHDVPFTDRVGHEQPFAAEVLFDYGSSLPPDRVITAARCALLFPFSLLLFISLCGWARRLTDRTTAALVLWLAAAEPSLLAYGGIVGDDFPCAVAWVCFGWRLHRFLSTASKRNGILAGLALALALDTKFTGVLLIPVAGAAVLWRLFVVPPAERRALLRGALWAAGTVGVLGLFFYGTPPGWDRYWFGIHDVYRDLVRNPMSYLFGHIYYKPPFYFYPCAILMKGGLLLLIGALGSLFLRRSAIDRFCLWGPVVILLGVASFDLVGAGVRRVLPVIAFLPLFFAIAWQAWKQKLARPAFLAGVLIAFQIGTALLTFPNYLSYFNPAARLLGEPQDLLWDCSLDWGQGLKALQKYLDHNALNAAGGRICYFGMAYPDVYGVHLTPVTLSTLLNARPPGLYAVSLQNLIYAQNIDPNFLPAWTKRTIVGDSICVFWR